MLDAWKFPEGQGHMPASHRELRRDTICQAAAWAALAQSELQMGTTTVGRWLPAPSRLTLSRDEIHVWCACLDATESWVHDLGRTLARDEILRAERIRFPEERNRFIVARGSLRCILGRYLNTPPKQLQFRYGPYGKPSLAAESGGKRLHFNLSHSHSLLLCAIAWDRRIGVDLERIQPIHDAGQLVESCFSASEQAAFWAVPSEKQSEAFYRCWTRKEAFLKAKGIGLNLPLDQFAVTLAPGKPARLLEVAGDRQEVSRWTMGDLRPSPGYVGAFAVKGHGLRVARWRWMQ